MVFVGGEEFFRTKWVVPGVFSSLIFVSPYIRTVKTASGAMAVQVVFSERKGAKRMKHIGSAHSESELALLRVETRINTVQQVSGPLTGNRQRVGNAACCRWGV